ECAFTRAFVADTTRHGHDVLMHKDGHLCDVAYAASPLLAAGVNLGVVIEVRDVTIEKTLEAARRALLENEQRARSEAEASNRAKDEFLAMLGHELRNPLAAITNASHLWAIGEPINCLKRARSFNVSPLISLVWLTTCSMRHVSPQARSCWRWARSIWPRS
ncbi:MAG TPA: histidine kinase dimerization/phospho-acceptor domain-containing protein, partial [Burkholderiaceae bacterium]|nr:histidine kinase dimerization/phospho-acceptor domain-containing protein [Burkholderiaceae bacterium]